MSVQDATSRAEPESNGLPADAAAPPSPGSAATAPAAAPQAEPGRAGPDAAPVVAQPPHLGRVRPPPGLPERLYDKMEAFLSRLSARDNFWNSILSLIWLPLAFFSGIKMKRIDATTFAAYLPFRRFNRNWYRAMAGGALLANSEIAGGMYVFGICGGDYTVVCKHLEYNFLRPCFGPAVYRMKGRQNLHDLLAAGGEFNFTLDLEIQQQGFRPGERDKRVGQCVAIFHVTPKLQHKVRAARKRK
ncbi:MAG TPA: hypothetical protein VHY37_11140 [Tepidisphaeraceae bacterium]|jgi:hypothetical protein|nr:hypothetical protein [Tepidisphaeraceae bacterium]